MGSAMTIAAAIEGRTAEAKAWSQPIRIAGVDIIHDLGAAEAIWRACENPHVSYTLSALRFPRGLAAAGRRARGPRSLHRGCL
jgi:hypothetical protein